MYTRAIDANAEELGNEHNEIVAQLFAEYAIQHIVPSFLLCSNQNVDAEIGPIVCDLAEQSRYS